MDQGWVTPSPSFIYAQACGGEGKSLRVRLSSSSLTQCQPRALRNRRLRPEREAPQGGSSF